jgi:hypothetical protein
VKAEETLARTLHRLGYGIRELASQTWDARTSTIGGVRDIDLACIAAVDDGWSFLLLPLAARREELLGEAIARDLSTQTAHPALAFAEYDETVWGYALFEAGERRDRFWSRPDVLEIDPEDCAGSVTLVASSFGVKPRAIGPYLRHIAADAPSRKAFPDDEFALRDHWVRCDFMRRLGLRYAVGDAGARHIQLRRL